MVVPIPRAPVKNDGVVVVEMSEPTVNCEVVAIRAEPFELEVMMEFGAKEMEPVPPLVTGRVPVTCDVRET